MAIKKPTPKPKASPTPKKTPFKRIVSPSKMTPSQKADYLKNPRRFDPLG